ncbi:MAG: tetratricopeptide repeat protein [Alphaproteobacteria bacterium]
MSDVFNEVDEEVRQEQWQKLFRAYGAYIIGAVASFIAVFAGSIAWDEYQTSQRQFESERYVAASQTLSDGDPSLAAQQFGALADDAGDGYGALARLREADALAKAGDMTGAVATLDRLADDSGADMAFRDLARLITVYQLMESASRDELDRRLAPLLSDESPWRASARELSGLIALRAGETSAARDMFTAIVEDSASPSSARSRAAGMLAIIGKGG